MKNGNMYRYVADWIADQLREVPTVEEVTPVRQGFTTSFTVTYTGNHKFRITVEETE